MPRRRRWPYVLLAIPVVVVALVGALVLALRHPMPPPGERGAAADAMARSLAAAVHTDAWERTNAVRWSFSGRHWHLWDKARMLDRVRWGKDLEVLLDIGRKQGRAYENGVEITDGRRAGYVEKAYAYWANDSFWLNPLAKLFDPGVTRSVVTLEDGRKALLVEYGSGGVTPGDKYGWIPGPDGKPAAWRLWVKILPIPGVEGSWEGWTALSTGALVSTRHTLLPGVHPRLDDVAGATTLVEIEPGPDPFARLFQ